MKIFLVLSCLILLNFCCGSYCNSKSYSYSYTRTLELIHNNFGWGQNSDEELDGGASDSGWYHKGLFDSNNGPEEKFNTFRSDDSDNFKYSNNILVHIQ